MPPTPETMPAAVPPTPPSPEMLAAMFAAPMAPSPVLAAALETVFAPMVTPEVPAPVAPPEAFIPMTSPEASVSMETPEVSVLAATPEATAPIVEILPAPVDNTIADPAPPVIPPPSQPETVQAEPEERKGSSFEAKTFKVVPTVRSFRVVGSDADPMPGAPMAVPAEAFTPSPQEPEVDFRAADPVSSLEPQADINAAPFIQAPEPELEFPASDPLAMQPLMEAIPEPPVAAMAADLAAAPADDLALAPAPASSEMPDMPPIYPAPAVAAPLQSFAPMDPMFVQAQPMPDFPPPNTLVAASAEAPSRGPDEVLARFAKPVPEPVTDLPRKPARNNKPFVLVVGLVVFLIMGAGLILLRQPKDDLKQMTALDDGKAPIGAASFDEGHAPAAAKPGALLNEIPASEPPRPAASAASAEQAAAIALVKDFPLDGDRGTVGHWLQYSYTASPGAGTEQWNASPTADKTFLVEYRLLSGPKGGKSAMYLFEADTERGLIVGKNLDARQMLAGSRATSVKAAKKVVAKKVQAVKPVKRAPARAPKGPTLLPLPEESQLATSHIDEDAFGDPVSPVKKTAAPKARKAAKVQSVTIKHSARKLAEDAQSEEEPDQILPDPGEARTAPVDEDAFGVD